MNPWEQIKQALAGRIGQEAFRNWVARTSFLNADSDTIVVAVPDTHTREWMEGEFGERVLGAIGQLNLPYRQVRYEVVESGLSPAIPFDHEVKGNEGLFQSPVTQLNPRFTFETFVVGSCNQFAHAAAKAVASRPSSSYNPLFIYGGSGMGKTHLLHAIGRSLVDNFSGMKIVYATGEKFMNLMINCIKVDRMAQFHRHFRSADVLLIDDIHVLGGKERTQEEFFHTFNELYDHQKQIVLSSDSPPKTTPGLVDRLRSRFEWGLMVDVQPPDLETKMAILDKKAEQEQVQLPEDVRVYIATRTKSNVRELEGALVKVVAYSSVSGMPITLQMSQQVLKHIGHGAEKKISIESIIRAVAERFSLQPAQLKAKSNTRQIAFPRQVAMFLVKELTHASLPEIGRAFGGKHHTTVLHSVQKIQGQKQKDPDLNRMLHSLIDSLN